MAYQLHSHIRVIKGKNKGSIGEIISTTNNGWHKVQLNNLKIVNLRSGEFNLVNKTVESKSKNHKKYRNYRDKKNKNIKIKINVPKRRSRRSRPVKSSVKKPSRNRNRNRNRRRSRPVQSSVQKPSRNRRRSRPAPFLKTKNTRYLTSKKNPPKRNTKGRKKSKSLEAIKKIYNKLTGYDKQKIITEKQHKELEKIQRNKKYEDDKFEENFYKQLEDYKKNRSKYIKGGQQYVKI